MIDVKELKFSYKNDRIVLEKICFKSEAGRCVAVLGNNGAGKSTLIKCLNRILKPAGGCVTVDNRDVKNLKLGEMAKLMSYLAQQGGVDRFTVFDAVLLGRKPHIRIEPTAKDLDIVESVIERMGLADKKLRYVDELSGGERQKVMLARALAQQPQIVLLDEPTSNLDLNNQYEMLSLVREMALQKQMVVIIVIHDLNLALRYCDSFLLMKAGVIHAVGGREVITPENIQDVYGIDVVVEKIRGVSVVIPMKGNMTYEQCDGNVEAS